MYAFVRSLTPHDVEAIAAQLFFVELLKRGFTSVAEFHYSETLHGTPYEDPVEMARRILKASEATGIGLTILPTLYQASDFGGG